MRTSSHHNPRNHRSASYKTTQAGIVSQVGDVEQGALVRRYGLIDENGEVWSSEFSAYLLRSH